MHRPRRAPFVLALVATAVASCGDRPTEPLPTGLAILDVSPEILRPGDQVVLSTQDFSPDPALLDVRIHDVPVPIESTGPGSITVRLPDTLCLPRGDAPVVVVSEGESSDPFARRFEPDRVLELAAGEFVRIAPPEDRCLVLPESSGPAEYLVGTQVTVELLAPEDVALRARASGPVPGGAARAHAASTLTAPGPRTASRPTPARWIRHRAAEAELRTREASLVLGPAPPAALALRSEPARVPSDVQPGDVVELVVPNVSEDFCDEGVAIEARVREVGARAIWLHDVENPEGGFSQEHYETLSAEFDQRVHDELVSYFGEPTDLDANGRVVVVVSQAVNRVSDALAFVVSTDFGPLTGASCPGANSGEYYYARAPDPEGSIPDVDGDTGAVYPVEAALSDAPRLLAHEVTHIIQFGRRFQALGSGGSQVIWLMEGQATLGEEVVGHRYSGAAPRQDLDGATALRADYPPTAVSWYQAPFTDLAVYYGFGVEEGDPIRIPGAPEECTWLSVDDVEPCISGRIGYGVTWSFLRWVSDHFAGRFEGGERELQRRILESPAFGLDVFEEVLGESTPELLAPWAASLYTDGRVTGGEPLLTFPSWDLRDIEARLHPVGRLAPDPLAFAGSDRTVEVAGGSTYYQLLDASTAHPSFALTARAGGGGELPDHVQLWVARIR